MLVKFRIYVNTRGKEKMDSAKTVVLLDKTFYDVPGMRKE